MKNVKEWQKKKCIAMSLEDYSEIIENLTDNKFTADIDYVDFGVVYEPTDDNEEEDTDITGNVVLEMLSGYFDVDVTSVHTDGFDVPFVWVVYKEKVEC